MSKRWEWRDADAGGRWTAFKSRLSRQIEEAFSEYLSSHMSERHRVFSFRIGLLRQQDCEIDFRTMHQRIGAQGGAGGGGGRRRRNSSAGERLVRRGEPSHFGVALGACPAVKIGGYDAPVPAVLLQLEHMLRVARGSAFAPSVAGDRTQPRLIFAGGALASCQREAFGEHPWVSVHAFCRFHGRRLPRKRVRRWLTFLAA